MLKSLYPSLSKKRLNVRLYAARLHIKIINHIVLSSRSWWWQAAPFGWVENIEWIRTTKSFLPKFGDWKGLEKNEAKGWDLIRFLHMYLHLLKLNKVRIASKLWSLILYDMYLPIFYYYFLSSVANKWILYYIFDPYVQQ